MSGSSEDDRLRIGELSARSGVSIPSLRHYERLGLIEGERLANGYRVFPAATVDRARSARLLFQLGADRDAVRSVMACTGDVPAEVHRATRGELERVRDRMGERIAELTRAHAALSEVIESTERAAADEPRRR